jgi:hypothetical protein
VVITTLPTASWASFNGIGHCTAGDEFTTVAGQLTWHWSPTARPTTPCVPGQDNGGTASPYGRDLDQSINTITFNVTAVNDAPDCGRQLARAAINVAVSVAANGTDVENVI